ncbi:MAG: PilZ domain-containing protein [Acidobacteriia bacterium]|nr:PilZ domain-containing protein [Terriglobia bacterium]
MREDAGASYHRKLIVGGTDQRCARRYYLGMSALLKVFNEIHPSPAFIRDCSWAGIFLYSAWVPPLASEVEIALEAPQVRVQCTGRVVRVEPATAGAVTGVAVSLQRCEVVRQPTNQPTAETPSAPG